MEKDDGIKEKTAVEPKAFSDELKPESGDEPKNVSDRKNKTGNKKGRRSHLGDFSMNLNGEYVYRGEYYEIDGVQTAKNPRGGMRRLMAICVAVVTLTVILGSIPAEAPVRIFYVTLPLAFQEIFMLRLIWIVGRAYYKGQPLREYVYNKTVKKFHTVATVLFVLACLTFVSWSMYTLFNGLSKTPAHSLIFASVQIVNIVIIRLFIVTEQKIKWLKVE